MYSLIEKHQFVTEVKFRDCAIWNNREFRDHFCPALALNESITDIDLANNFLSSENMKSLASVISKKQIRSIDLSYTPISERTIKKILLSPVTSVIFSNMFFALFTNRKLSYRRYFRLLK